MCLPPKLCIDSDALTNLLALGCLADVLSWMGCTENMVYRLPPIVAQLERAKWVGERWPKANRAILAEAARRIAVLPPPQDLSVQSILNSREDIDEGEAYIVAKALEDPTLLVLTGDGRMVRALHQPPEVIYLESLRGRVILFPQAVGALANRLSIAEIEARWRAAAPDLAQHRQKSLSVMFGSTSPTRTEDFWSGYELQISRVTDVCGPDWLYPL